MFVMSTDVDVVASYELFTAIMASDGLAPQHWEAARIAVCGHSKKSLRWNNRRWET